MSSSTLKLKQEIIKSEIMDKNYNTEKFLNFCISKKEHGDDLNNWSLLELNEAISEFIKIENGETNPQNTENIISDISVTPTNLTDINPVQQVPTNYQPVPTQNVQTQKPAYFHENLKSKAASFITGLFSKITGNKAVSADLPNVLTSVGIYEKEVICKKLDKTELNDKDIKVIIRDPKSSESSILKSAHVTYEVYTEQTKWSVRRRYNDFDWLRTTLVKFYPRILIPPIPGKKIGPRRFEEDFIQKRMNFLQKFIDNVMLVEELKASEALICFLKMGDRSQFESKMKELTSFIPSPYVEDMKTFSGKLKAIDSDSNDQYFANITNYFTLQNQLYSRLNYNLKNFYLNIGAACNNLEEVDKDLDTLHLLNIKVSTVIYYIIYIEKRNY